MREIEEYVQSRRSRLDEWRQHISKLKRRAQGSESNERLRAQLSSLQHREQAVRHMVDSLPEAGKEEWKELKSGVEQAYRQLEDSIRQASSVL